MTPIQANNVPFYLSADGTNYKEVVCLEQWGVPLDTDTTETATFCGNSVGVGITKFKPTLSAVCEQSPGASQVTADTLAAWQLANTPLWFKVQYPTTSSTGNKLFLSGQCYVTSVNVTGQVNDVVKFTVTLTGFGTIDLTP